MTNFDRWQNLMRNVCAPQSFIDFGFYYMISVALQRRVWTGPEHMPLFPNQYIILVGEPGVGKGVTIKPVTELIKFHKLKISQASPADAVANFAAAGGVDLSRNEPPKLLFPVLSEAITYEALTRAICRNIRHINYKTYDTVKQRELMKIYTHASSCFCLEEMSSLFHREADKVVNFLLVAWDCGDYDYETKGSGHDQIKKCCTSMIAGTTPKFMQETFSSRLIGEGFTARTLFIFETENRFNILLQPELDDSQREDLKALRAHLHTLSTLYGHAPLTEDAREYLDEWWQGEHQEARAKVNEKLLPYWAKKNMHVLKLALAKHFAEYNGRMEITLNECKWAMEMLSRVERNMHMALNFGGGRNPLALISQKIYKYLIKNKRASYEDLLIMFIDDVSNLELRECLDYLVLAKQIKKNGPNYEAVLHT